VWVPPQPDAAPVLLGEPCVTPADCAHLAQGLTRTSAGAPDPVFCNDVPKVWGDRLPGVSNLLALPVADHGLPGWVIAINKRAREREGPKPRPDLDSSSFVPSPFRRSDAALLTPFVALLGLHARAARRYQDLKELLVGLTRSLTAALDAKDSYTFGHSE